MSEFVAPQVPVNILDRNGQHIGQSNKRNHVLQNEIYVTFILQRWRAHLRIMVGHFAHGESPL